MYPSSGGNTYGYGRSGAMPSSSKNQQHGKYTSGSSAGYGVGGSAASSSLGSKGARTRDTSYGTGKQTSIKDSSGAGSSGQRKSIYDRAPVTSVSKPVGGAGGYQASSSVGLGGSRTMNGSSALGAGTSGYSDTHGSGYTATSSMLQSSLRHKSKNRPSKNFLISCDFCIS